MAKNRRDGGYVNFSNDYMSSQPFEYVEKIYQPYYDLVDTNTLGMNDQEKFEYYESLSEEELYASIKSDIRTSSILKIILCLLELIVAVTLCTTISIRLITDYFYDSNINIPNNYMLKHMLTPSAYFSDINNLF